MIKNSNVLYNTATSQHFSLFLFSIIDFTFDT